MKTLIKICGVCTAEDAELAVKYGVDYIGLIFVKSSPRFVEPDVAKSIAERVRGKIAVVGVFQNSSLQEMENIDKLVGLEYFQLHGEESPTLCRDLNKPVTKVFQLGANNGNEGDCITLSLDLAKNKQDRVILEKYQPYCQYFLYDRPKGNDDPAWINLAIEALSQIEKATPNYFFAGGLNADNVQKVLQKLKPAGLDVASGVEEDKRKKSETLIADLLAKMKVEKDEGLASQNENRAR